MPSCKQDLTGYDSYASFVESQQPKYSTTSTTTTTTLSSSNQEPSPSTKENVHSIPSAINDTLNSAIRLCRYAHNRGDSYGTGN